ncbi:hypothetical protein Tco_0394679 [Tanacetum coccineum]
MGIWKSPGETIEGNCSYYIPRYLSRHLVHETVEGSGSLARLASFNLTIVNAHRHPVQTSWNQLIFPFTTTVILPSLVHKDHSRMDLCWTYPDHLLDQGKSRLLREAGITIPKWSLGNYRRGLTGAVTLRADRVALGLCYLVGLVTVLPGSLVFPDPASREAVLAVTNIAKLSVRFAFDCFNLFVSIGICSDHGFGGICMVSS